MDTVGYVTICEHIGMVWPSQYVKLSVKLTKHCRIDMLSVLDESGCAIEYDLISLNGNDLKIGIFLSLQPWEKRNFTVVENDLPVKRTLFGIIERKHDEVKITAGQLTCILPTSGSYGSSVPPPIKYISNGMLSATGNIDTHLCEAIITTHIRRYPLHIEAFILYRFQNADTYHVHLVIYKDRPLIILNEEYDMKDRSDFSLLFNDFCTSCVYARMHTPKKETGETDEWKRITYTVNSDPVRLQPFYSWDRDSATLMQVMSKTDGFICIVPICPSKWMNGYESSLSVMTGNAVSIHSPLKKGKRKWLLFISDSRQAPYENISFTLSCRYQNWDNMMKTPIRKIYAADGLCAVYGGPGLDQAIRWTSPLPDMPHDSPRLLIQKKDLQRFRNGILGWTWMRNTVMAHKDDKEGFDPAGVYNITGDEKYAAITKGYIMEWLDSRIWMITKMGYSLHEVVCIRLSRPLRLVALDYDLTASSACYTEEDHVFILNAFAFLAQCTASPDYWPDKATGFKKGNHNFHSDRFSTLGTLACLLTGYHDSKKWISYVQKEIENELDTAVLPGGVWIEAPNYQAYSMNYLILLFTVLKNCGYRDNFKNSKFVETMDFLAFIQTIKDIRCGIKMMPTLGDTAANYWSQGFMNIFAWAANMAKDNKDFSKRMMRSWIGAGKPVFNAGGELNSTFKTAALIDPDLKAAENSGHESRYYPGFGAVIKSDDGYLSVKCGEACMHYDHDEGSMIWYAKGVPVLADIGSQYFPSCDASFLHNRISIDHKTDESRGKVLYFASTPKADCIIMKVTISRLQEWPKWPIRDPFWNFRYQPSPADIPMHTWIRTVIYLKDEGALALRDEVKGGLPYDQNYLIYSDSYSDHHDHLEFKGQFGVDIALWNFGSISRNVSDWEYDGLDEPMFKKAFGQDWHDYRWMWEGDMTAMGEKIQLLRNDCAPDSVSYSFLASFDSDPGSVSKITEHGLEWEKKNKNISIYFPDDMFRGGKIIFGSVICDLSLGQIYGYR